jgi:DNA-binding response OmpR family regulator
MITERYTILIGDDDLDILNSLRIYLESEGYDVIAATNGEEVLRAVHEHSPHLVLLDVMMPVLDGIQTAERLREFSNIPLIFLSAKGEEADRVLGLHVGGDDYIVKPFAPAELFARVRSALRRYAQLGGAVQLGGSVVQLGVAALGSGTQLSGAALGGGTLGGGGTHNVEDDPETYRVGTLVLDDRQKIVTVNGDVVNLTAFEFNILRLLIASPDRVFSSTQIYETVRGEPACDVNRLMSVHIRHIREKIEDNSKEPRYLKVVYGLGYKVASQP